ncbi:MAG: T9SS type A sorting domain-containing protein [Bacteroidales bacterium]|nr:T9SS type A sorting domain-containing protein [Bacteroidales bacterium]
MKKIYLLMLLCAAAAYTLPAQTVVFSDNFDSYTVGAHLAQTNSAWTTWDNAPGTTQDGVISSAQAASAPNSLYITGSNDQVYPFGNYVNGHYSVSFNMYVPSTGNGGYFNVQHVLLTQWAFECYFDVTGSGTLSVGGSDYTFTYTPNAWFAIVFDVDLDGDEMSITLNNNVIHTWPFHYQAGSTNGTNQLAGINFYAGAPNNASGTYYIDDFTVTELAAAQVGEFVVSPNEDINVSAGSDGASTVITVSNPGGAAIDYRVMPTYLITTGDNTPTGADTLTYCGESYSSLGFTGGADWEIAAGFPYTQMANHLGRTLNAIIVHLGAGADEGVTNAKVRVYATDELNSGPGHMIYEQNFTPVAGWNIVELTYPVLIDGGDLWIGAYATQPADVYLFSFDALLYNQYSAWFKNGSAWRQLASLSSEYNTNWCIKGVVDGTPMTPWMSITNGEGTLYPMQNQNVTINYSTAGMALNESKNGVLEFFSSAYNNPVEVLNVTLTYTNVSVVERQINISVYPNPAVENLNITSDQIERVEIYNLNGQMIYTGTFSDSHVTIPTKDFAAGMYTVKVTTANQTTTHKVVIQ